MGWNIDDRRGVPEPHRAAAQRALSGFGHIGDPTTGARG
jgi:hypothetical protein